MYFNRTWSFMQNVSSVANLKKYFSFIWGWRQWQESGQRAKERCLAKPTLCRSLSLWDGTISVGILCSRLSFSNISELTGARNVVTEHGSHFSPKFKHPGFHHSHVLIIDLDQKYCLVDVGPSTRVSAARHPSVNHLVVQNETRH